MNSGSILVQRRYAAQTMVGLVSLIAGIAIPYLWVAVNPWISIILIAFGVVALLTGLLMLWSPPKEPVYDERIVKVRNHALSSAWVFSFMAVVLLYLVNKAGLIQITADEALALTFLAIVGSGSVMQWHYFRKGDVE